MADTHLSCQSVNAHSDLHLLIISLFRLSSSQLSVAELFQWLPLGSGMHCLTMSRHHPSTYSDTNWKLFSVTYIRQGSYRSWKSLEKFWIQIVNFPGLENHGKWPQVWKSLEKSWKVWGLTWKITQHSYRLFRRLAIILHVCKTNWSTLKITSLN